MMLQFGKTIVLLPSNDSLLACFRDHLAMLELMPTFQMMPGLRLLF